MLLSRPSPLARRLPALLRPRLPGRTEPAGRLDPPSSRASCPPRRSAFRRSSGMPTKCSSASAGAVLGGFLLTASKNWVGVRGYHGGTLMFLAAAWIFERIGMSFGTAAGRLPLFLLSNNLFLFSIVVLLLATLIRHRDKDSYRRDNIFFLIILPLFWVAKTLLLSARPLPSRLEHDAPACSAVAFLVMLERTLEPVHARRPLQVEILRRPALDLGDQGTRRPARLRRIVSRPVGAPALNCCWRSCCLAASPSGIRSRPSRRLEIGIMVPWLSGHRHTVADRCPAAAGAMLGWVGTVVGSRLFTFGAMGLVIPGNDDPHRQRPYRAQGRFSAGSRRSSCGS